MHTDMLQYIKTISHATNLFEDKCKKKITSLYPIVDYIIKVYYIT